MKIPVFETMSENELNYVKMINAGRGFFYNNVSFNVRARASRQDQYHPICSGTANLSRQLVPLSSNCLLPHQPTYQIQDHILCSRRRSQ